SSFASHKSWFGLGAEALRKKVSRGRLFFLPILSGVCPAALEFGRAAPRGSGDKKSDGRLLIYTPGKLPQPPGSPLFLAGPARSECPLGELEQFSKDRIKSRRELPIRFAI